MCGNAKSADVVPPSPVRRSSRIPAPGSTPSASTAASTPINTSSSAARTPFEPSTSYKNSSSTASTSSRASSLASLRESLPENPHIYSFQVIAAATNNFLAKRLGASASAAWRCSIHGKDVVVVQRRLRRPLPTEELRRRLGILCRSHHAALAKLLGASLSGEYIYLVYEFVLGAKLSECLRNPRNPDFTVLSTWSTRMQIADDLAHGLEYIHHSTGLDLFLVHNHIKSSAIVVTEPKLCARICHFGAAELAGEIADAPAGEIVEEGFVRRSGSRSMRVEGTRGYMAPEIISGGQPSQKSDVYAFGVVMLELLTGQEPLRYRFDRGTGNYERISLIETAGEVAEAADEGKLRRWVDRRLRDSYPTDVAQKAIRLALDCVHVDADKRPDMRRVKGKISKLYLESKVWSEKVRVPTEISVSIAGR